MVRAACRCLVCECKATWAIWGGEEARCVTSIALSPSMVCEGGSRSVHAAHTCCMCCSVGRGVMAAHAAQVSSAAACSRMRHAHAALVTASRARTSGGQYFSTSAVAWLGRAEGASDT